MVYQIHEDVRRNMRILTILFSISVAGGLQIAPAATITEFNRATFQTALGSATLSGQNFDLLPLGTITSVNGVTYMPSLGTALVTDTFLTTTPPNGLGSTSFGFFGPTETLTLTFSSSISAFALDINTFATNSGDYQASVNDGSGSVIPSVFDVFPNAETGQFIGFTDTSSFTTVIISGVADPGTDGGNCAAGLCSYTVDTLVYGNASAIVAPGVPEPSTIVLVGMGISAAGLLARWRKTL